MKNLFSQYVERFENLDWLENNIDEYSFESLSELYDQCIFAGLIKSSNVVLKTMCKKTQTEEQTKYIVRLLNKEIFKHTSNETIRNYFKNVIRPAIVQNKNKTSICFHVYGWLYGGAERAISTLLNDLCEDYEVFLIVFSPVENSTFSLNQNINFLEIKEPFDNIRRLYKLVCLLSPDVFVGNNNSIPEFLPIYEWLSDEKIKTIAYCHEYYFFMHQNNILCKYAQYKNFYLNQANAVVFLTSFSTNAYSLINKNGATIPNALSVNTVTNTGFKKKSKNILAVGRFFDYIKRVDLLLEVFAKVKKMQPDIELTIVGKYDMELDLPEKNCTVSEWMKKLKLDNSCVHFVGNQTNVDDWYMKNDILLMTSDNEGFGMVLIEAGYYGLPCVVFDIPGLEDIIINGENGYIVPRDVNAMAEKINKLLVEEDLRAEMSLNAQQRAERYNIKNIKTLWSNLIEEVTSQDSQEKINSFIKKNYQKEITDMDEFSKKIINEYDNCLLKLIK